MDGLAANCEIRRLEAINGRRRTTLIALTVDAVSHRRGAYHIAGMDGAVTKPIQVATLRGALCLVSPNDLDREI